MDRFSEDYFDARERFCRAATEAGATLQRYPIQFDDSLTIDVAILNRHESENLIVLSSGVHGVEGQLGSAAQLATLEFARSENFPDNVGLVLIHAINPYGYAFDRRWNEDNVDLNRNFPCSTNTYAGAATGYVQMDSLLNPKSPPSRLEPYRMIAIWNILRYGTPAVKEAVATGQYEYPQGLFFGGKKECCSSRIVRENFRSWLGEAKHIVHLDFHTGLGRFGDYRLLLQYPPDSPHLKWFGDHVDAKHIEPAVSSGTSYQARGTFGLWSRDHMKDSNYHFATVEFGTHHLIRVLGALRAENRVHHYAKADPRYQWVREELRECFCPASPKWRSRVIDKSLDVVQRCASALTEKSGPRSTVKPKSRASGLSSCT